MARRKGQAAEFAVQNQASNRWRILLRHKKFQKQLNWLRGQYQKWVQGPPITRYTFEFEGPDLNEFETEIPRQTESKISRKDVDLFDEYDPNDSMVGMPEGAWPDFNSKWGIYLPKAGLSEALPDLRQDTISQWTEIFSREPAIVPFPVKAGHSRMNWLRLEVNLTYPRDILIERVEKEISKAMSQSRKVRRRWNKFDYYFQVYDSAMAGETFTTISRTLKKRVSTVKSAFLAIGKMIYFCDRPGLARSDAHRESTLPKKKTLVLMNFDSDTHISRCEICKKALAVSQMCRVSKIFASQEYRSRDQGVLQLDDWII
jgi:hypothetical protein